jgi:hypothetical protein
LPRREPRARGGLQPRDHNVEQAARGDAAGLKE